MGRLQRVRDPDTNAVVEYIFDGVNYKVSDFKKKLQEMFGAGDPDARAIIERVPDFQSLRKNLDAWKKAKESKELGGAIPSSVAEIDQEIADYNNALGEANVDPRKAKEYRARIKALERAAAKLPPSTGQQFSTAHQQKKAQRGEAPADKPGTAHQPVASKQKFDQMPDPTQYKGRTITDDETGESYESDGTKWVKKSK